MKTIRILLADDHNILRDGLRVLLERQPGFEVVAEASDGREAVVLAEQHRPDVAVIDIAMPGLNGIEATRRICGLPFHIAVIILSMHSDDSYILRSLKAGARAYLLKDSAKADLIAAIRAVVEGNPFFSPRVTQVLQDSQQAIEDDKEDSYELLTGREREILQLVAEGKSNKEIASQLNLSTYTVDTHRSHVLRKLNLHSVPEVILYAVRKRIIS
jgi:DNA-binding NarL/FixJ family response regulator